MLENILFVLPAFSELICTFTLRLNKLSMDLRDQLKNLFPDHEEQDFEMPLEKFEQVQPLVCKFEKKGRNGKPVTLIEGFEGSDDELKQL